MVQRVLFVCTGNICRSPLAEAVFRNHINDMGQSEDIQVDSAGTHDYHVGERPDPRTLKIADMNSISTGGIYARKIEKSDFEHFDLILGMDQGHVLWLQQLCPDEFRYKIHLFMDFAGEGKIDVPDPYYVDFKGFQEIYDMILEVSQKFDLTLSKILCKL